MTIDIICASSGLDQRRRRGYEQSTLITHRRLRERGVQSLLVKGSSQEPDEFSTSVNFPPFIRLLHFFGSQVGETFMFEYILFAFRIALLRELRIAKFIYTQEPWVARTLTRLKQFGLIKSQIQIHFVCGVTMNEEFIPRFGDVQWVVNPEVYRLAKGKFRESKIFYLPNPIEPSKKFSATQRDSKSPFPKTRKKWILVVGAINRTIKRTHLITEAWAGQYSEEYGLCLLGQIQDPSIIEPIKEHPAFVHHFVAPEDVPKFIYFADHVCLASLHEGFPNILLECVVNGKVPYLTDNSANRFLLPKISNHLIDFNQSDWISHLMTDDKEPDLAEKLSNHYAQGFERFTEYIYDRCDHS